MEKITAKTVMMEAIALKDRKSQDYQGGKWTEEDYFPFGDLSYMHMIHTKYLRMRNIMDKDVVNFEGMEDSLVDMINYCAMYSAYIQNQKAKEYEEFHNDEKLAYYAEQMEKKT